MVKKKSDKNIEKVGVPIEWYVPEGMITPFATNMVVQPMESEFRVSFFEIKPAIKLDKTEPLPSKVRADCVASVIITIGRLQKFIDVLQKQLDNHPSKKQT